MALFDTLLMTAGLGGLSIGLAVGTLSLFTGRVMSASAMLGSLLGGAEGVAATSITFIAGLVIASFLMAALGFAPESFSEPGLPLLIFGGLLVGASARWGGASLGGVFTGMARRVPRALTMLVAILVGATIGGVVQAVLGGLGA